MTDLPHIYDTTRSLTIKLPLEVMAKLATYQREMHPGRSVEAVAAYLVRDALVGLGLLDLPRDNRGKAAGRK